MYHCSFLGHASPSSNGGVVQVEVYVFGLKAVTFA